MFLLAAGGNFSPDFCACILSKQIKVLLEMGRHYFICLIHANIIILWK